MVPAVSKDTGERAKAAKKTPNLDKYLKKAPGKVKQVSPDRTGKAKTALDTQVDALASDKVDITRPEGAKLDELDPLAVQPGDPSAKIT